MHFANCITDFIPIPDFLAGALENWGLVTFSENAYYYDPVVDPYSQKERVAAITAHEVAHMNFGNLVTTKWWDDMWLNEGFASYLEYAGLKIIDKNWATVRILFPSL
jgi:aminopeptidase N